MSISAQEIKDAAWDARLELDSQEESELLKEAQQLFEDLVSFIDPTFENISQTFYPISSKAVMREDEVELSLPVNTALANAPDADDFCHHVPRIIEE
ncbi:Asp-tRNA(Asn)/Glu-tRNA(Gln) amidotransferase subunit GatC [Candidatus Contubernalis alkaliaceticus]|uniref:Asp-tRNA(Asn)/Glu-tRNA(Gln) amidotransferase subunit GatC n=1 Tax=Candidatus Contubernalis alkaliaceticus TaxID=338645 RepID=UPI001F4C099A|nr:Asp-tRNA(Asn)/Glu-tRNA(Gln) amidotransferase subunit GatC [Candidatus Contubernalis alkalaceticus]UNC91490.1 aspartyl/glutamyl-tRNA amidotransferase subunit C [Candidatus Contubernalis alkalaceticus]